MGRRRKQIEVISSHPALALAALVLISACNGTGPSLTSEPPAPTGTASIAIATPTPVMVIPGATPTPTVAPPAIANSATPSPALATVAPSRGPAPTPVPSPVGPLAGVSLPLPQDDTTTWYLPGSPHIAAMRDTIVTVFHTNELEFDLGYPVQGFSPDPIYPRLFIRDTSTLMVGASYFYPAERLRWSVEAFLRQQYDETTVSSEDGWRAGFGAISATVGPDGVIDKATAVSDEDAHLIHAAYVVYQVNGGVDWLAGELNRLPVITRLNAAGEWLLAQRRDETTGLIKRDHPFSGRLDLAYETNHQVPTFPLRLLLPLGFTPGEVWLDGLPLAWDTFTLGQDTYLAATLPTGRHSLVVGGCHGTGPSVNHPELLQGHSENPGRKSMTGRIIQDEDNDVS